MYVQHAAHRLYPERVKELIRRSHEMLVPTFIVISDKWSVGKQELATKESEVAELVDQACPPPERTRTAGGARPPPPRAPCDAQVGANKRGKLVVQLSLSSKPKAVGATTHPVAGIPEFVSKLLSTLDPADALTFLRHDGLLTKVLGKRRRTDGDEAEAEEAE